ncbi:MAG: isochorismate synthase [Deltaproteobacteria bacterium]|nr:MAG: isochorismate synthase [Deltaproteobacteria bacterium]
MSASAATAPRHAWREAGRALREAMASVRGKKGLHLLSVPAPVARLETLLRHLPAEDAVLFDPPSGAGAAGVGAAYTLRAEGEARFGAIAREAREITAGVRCLGLLGASALRPRFFGGFAFAPGWLDGPWDGFGDARFVLPRWTYLRRGAQATLSLAIHAEADSEMGLAGWVDEGVRLISALEADENAPPQGIWQAPLAELPPQEWVAWVEAARRAIADGELQKVVLSRRTRARLPVAIESAEILERLAAEHPDCFRFAIRIGGVTFLGAPPERLVARQGERVWADCLAGSIAAPEREGEATRTQRALQLLSSSKDRHEHRVVVDAVRASLARFCRTLTESTEPQVMHLRHVLHLHTPISGVLSTPVHVLELLEALHPTPAVGGVPREGAVEFIVSHEGDARGWYSGPVGYFDDTGDGEFAVAIRSGLVRGREAFLHAGAGIVAASDPHQEWKETAVKQRALLRALGIGG